MPPIVQAAIRDTTGVVHTVPRPARHADIFNRMRALHAPIRQAVQGFLDNTGRFLDRAEATRVAVESGQVRPTALRGGRLTTEDLW